MKLQLALDDITLDAAVRLLEQVSNYVDIIEIGTPLVIEYGMKAVRLVKANFPDKEILCDIKIMDGGKFEAASAFNAGADYVTVLGVTDSATINAVVQTALEYKRFTVADLICIDDFNKNIPLIESLGVNMLAVHVGVDQQALGRTPLQDLIEIKKLTKKSQIAVAGGINLSVLDDYIAQAPHVIIVGGAIIKAPNPAEIAMKFYDRMHLNEREK